MGKAVIYGLIALILIGAVFAVNYDYIYNPYTAKQDRSINLNQSGFNMSDLYVNNIYGLSASVIYIKNNLNLFENNITNVSYIRATGNLNIVPNTTGLRVWDDAEGTNDYIQMSHTGTDAYVMAGSGGTIVRQNAGGGSYLSLTNSQVTLVTTDNADIRLNPHGTGEVLVNKNVNMTGNNISHVDSIIGDSGPVIIGDSCVSTRSLTADDDEVVCGKLEVDGNLYSDYRITANCGANREAIGIESAGVEYGTLSLFEDDSLRILLNNAEGRSNRNLIIGDNTHYNKDYDHDVLSENPTVFIHSATSPDSDNTQWGSLSHDTDDFIIDSGTNSTRVVSELTAHNNFIAEADIIQGDSINWDLYQIEVNGTHVVFESFQNLQIVIKTYSPNGSQYTCGVNNSGSWVCS